MIATKKIFGIRKFYSTKFMLINKNKFKLIEIDIRCPGSGKQKTRLPFFEKIETCKMRKIYKGVQIFL